MSSGEAADSFPSKTMSFAPCVIPANFPWDCFPGVGKPMTGSYHCAALSRTCCNFQLVSCAPAIQSGLCLDFQAAEISHAGMLISGLIRQCSSNL